MSGRGVPVAFFSVAGPGLIGPASVGGTPGEDSGRGSGRGSGGACFCLMGDRGVPPVC